MTSLLVALFYILLTVLLICYGSFYIGIKKKWGGESDTFCTLCFIGVKYRISRFLADIMDSPELIRNVALCGHLHHGKVTPGCALSNNNGSTLSTLMSTTVDIL